MFSQIYYVIRSRSDGSYLVARTESGSNPSAGGYLLMFREDFEALSYLNKWGADVANRFAVESLPGSQVKSLLKRWGFVGVGVVVDPLEPRIEFLTQERSLE
ncbi:MAG TPA: hypothetical protein DCZ55_00860 [Cyanobacteria bacterium UBA11371]|nr:hypothetical protein [Cyanobacteria bacterium UBA11371]